MSSYALLALALFVAVIPPHNPFIDVWSGMNIGFAIAFIMYERHHDHRCH